MTKDEYEVYERVREQRDELRNALLEVEWIDVAFFATQGCPSCGCTHFAGHVDCKLDKALANAGRPDQASRDAVRKELRK